MVVQHNLRAMNSNRMLGITQGSLSKSTEKLSSGYQINRAADNAAGLAISEKMRKQIRGLDQASSNAEDGISTVQTAEGALNEVQDMLQRMNELAVQSANGTNSTSDRQYIQDEIDQLVSEVDRVSETTKFNETYLLKGDKSQKTSQAYTTTFAVTYAKNVAPNNVKNAAEYKMNYTGTNNIYMVSASVFGTGSNKALSADTVGTGSDITKYFNKNETGDDTELVTDELGTIASKATFNATSYVAFVAVELNSDVATKSGSYTDTEVQANATANTDLYIDTTQTGSVVRAAQDLFVYNTDTKTVTHMKAGDEMTKYLNDDNTMNDSYKLVDIISGKGTLQNNATADEVYGTTTLGSHVNVSNTAGGTDSWEWNASVLELDQAEQTLYDADGTEVSAMKLNSYFDENGNYKGGLYTTSQARDIDQVFASTSTAGYKNSTGIGADKMATIGAFISQSSTAVAGDVSIALQVGADSDRTNKITASISSISSAGLGIDKLSSKSIGLMTADNATDAIDVIADALTKVSRQRAALGAVQNRLEHTINNLDNVVENTTSAESQIRDTDMATEMVKYSNNNILSQAGQSMLAQSNQGNQGVLSLLG